MCDFQGVSKKAELSWYRGSCLRQASIERMKTELGSARDVNWYKAEIPAYLKALPTIPVLDPAIYDLLRLIIILLKRDHWR